MTVAMIERHLFGGTCVNTGCTPTKTLVASAEVAHQARRAAEYGVRIDGGISVDMRAVKARKDKIVATSRDGIEIWLGSMKGCTVFKGHARFESAHEVRVGDDVLRAKKIFINVGRPRAYCLTCPASVGVPTLNNTSILELDTRARGT